jgi:hypothetical protein
MLVYQRVYGMIFFMFHVVRRFAWQWLRCFQPLGIDSDIVSKTMLAIHPIFFVNGLESFVRP